MADMTWQAAIQKVLEEHGGAMHVQEITDRIIELDLRGSYGATPSASVGAQLATSVKHDEASPYIRVGKATFSLRGSTSHAPSQLDESSDLGVEDSGLVQAFGMYWQRDAVHWTTSSTAILGRQRIQAEAVNFSCQLGVYLLHDGREVVYVGRSTERPMGQRLFEHTKDRLQSRWDRFSWFGLLKVTDEGELVSADAKLTSELVATTLEAVLIEGLEPRQNRKRGDGFNATEYLQAEDPEIERRQGQVLLDSLKAKL